MKIPISYVNIHEHMELTPENIWGRNHFWSCFPKHWTSDFWKWALFGPYWALFGLYWSLFGHIGPYLALTVKQRRNTEGPHREHQAMWSNEVTSTNIALVTEGIEKATGYFQPTCMHDLSWRSLSPLSQPFRYLSCWVWVCKWVILQSSSPHSTLSADPFGSAGVC